MLKINSNLLDSLEENKTKHFRYVHFRKYIEFSGHTKIQKFVRR